MQNRIQKQFEGFLNTPALWKGSFGDLVQFKLPEIISSLQQPVGRDIPSLATNFVMGKRVERFFQWIIRQNPNYEILAENEQISRKKITLGELDFLLKDVLQQQVFHIEMVYKFYIYDPSFNSEIQRWIGPNRRDTLLQKIEKLNKQQFPLLYNPETENLLNSLGLNSAEILQQACFKANLFVPKQLCHINYPLINNKCISGFWLHFKDFKSSAYHNFLYYAPEKQDWPVLPAHGEIWLKHSEIILQIEILFQSKKAPLIWMKRPGNSYERIFVVWW